MSASKIKQEICRLMADGRERTAEDVQRKVGWSLTTVTREMERLSRLGLLRTNRIHNIRIWRAEV